MNGNNSPSNANTNIGFGNYSQGMLLHCSNHPQ